MSEREDLRIPSHGEQFAAYLYRPDGANGDRPCVVMAHGFSATRDDGLPAYAEVFRDAGFAVVLFDYRHFGASTGEPRQLLDITRQHEDYRAAIAWARRLEGIDPDRIVPPMNVIRMTATAIRDQLGAWRGQPPRLLPAVGEPGTLAAMTAPDAKPGFEAIVGPKSLWCNQFTARLMLRFPFYRPGR